jgi:hypothetical protein
MAKKQPKPASDVIRESTIDQCARAVPTNWCDALLTGPEAPGSGTWGPRDIERLLRGVQDRIRALKISPM